MDLTTHFQSVPGMIDRFRNGNGYNEEGRHSELKLCITATILEYLIQRLYEISQEPNCYRVKYRPRAKSGMYLGRVAMVSDEEIGKTWAILKKDPGFYCSIQDERFCDQYRDGDVAHLKAAIKATLG